jgi:hypothetical protein
MRLNASLHFPPRTVQQDVFFPRFLVRISVPETQLSLSISGRGWLTLTHQLDMTGYRLESRYMPAFKNENFGVKL